MKAKDRLSAIEKWFCRRLIGVIGGGVFMAAPIANSAEFYVATDGSDLNSGTLESPFATFKKAIGMAKPGDTVLVRGGTYREEAYVNRGGGTAGALLTITAYGEERPIVKGSDIVTGWEHHEGAIWKKTDWNVNSQQVFCNEVYLQQIGIPAPNYEPGQYKPVGYGVSDMYPGTFRYEAGEKTLYVWLKEDQDPNTATMEASVRPRVLYIDVPFVHVKGFTVRHSNSSQTHARGIAASVGTDSIIENCDIQWCDFEGLEIRDRSMAYNCIVSNNGDVGIGAGGVPDFVVRRCVINGNNYRRFNPSWHAGGLKLVPNANGIVEECEVSDNYGNGIWFDWCNLGKPIVIRNNTVRNNLKSGIFVEVCENTQVYNNLVVGSRERAIYISASNNTQVLHNTIVDAGGHSAISVAGVPRTGCTLKNNSVRNNIIFGSTCVFDLLVPGDNGSDTAGNTSDFNCVFRTSGSLHMNSSGKDYWTLESWVAGTGLDSNSINSNPEFVLANGDDFSTSPGSPVVDRGVDAGITEDCRGLPRPQGGEVDMGAFETSWRDCIPPSAPQNLSVNPVDWNSFKLQWEPATDNVGVACYEIYRDGVRYATSAECELVDSNLEPQRTFQYFVLALDEAGLVSPMSNVFEVSTGSPPDEIPPTQPSKMCLIAKSNSSLAMSWEPATDNVGVTKYCIWRNGARIAFVNSTWFTDTDLAKKTVYEYTVSAFDAAGNESTKPRPKAIRTLP
jgi:parallel beta-helix repeat protein